MDFTLDFIAGCMGGTAGVLVGHPFDTVKVRLQLQSGKNPIYKGILDCFKKVIQKESALGLYKGVTSPLCSLASINAIVFGVQGTCLRYMSDQNSLQSHFMAGAVAGFIQCGVCGPMELTKTRMQMQGQGERRGINRVYKGLYDCFRKIYRAEGVRGLLRGMNFTIIREVPAFGLYFLTYEALCRQFTPTGSQYCPTAGLLMAGGLSGCVSWMSVYPIDVIKSRIQADGTYSNGKFHYKYNGYRDCIRKSVADEGVFVFFRGLSSTLLRAFPTNAMTFAVVSWTLRLMKPTEPESERLSTLERAGMIAQLES